MMSRWSPCLGSVDNSSLSPVRGLFSTFAEDHGKTWTSTMGPTGHHALTWGCRTDISARHASQPWGTRRIFLPKHPLYRRGLNPGLNRRVQLRSPPGVTLVGLTMVGFPVRVHKREGPSAPRSNFAELIAARLVIGRCHAR